MAAESITLELQLRPTQLLHTAKVEYESKGKKRFLVFFCYLQYIAQAGRAAGQYLPENLKQVLVWSGVG